jgi:hypothetical protein
VTVHLWGLGHFFIFVKNHKITESVVGEANFQLPANAGRIRKLLALATMMTNSLQITAMRRVHYLLPKHTQATIGAAKKKDIYIQYARFLLEIYYSMLYCTSL